MIYSDVSIQKECIAKIGNTSISSQYDNIMVQKVNIPDSTISLGTLSLLPLSISLNTSFNTNTTSPSFHTMETLTNSTYEVDVIVAARVSSAFIASINVLNLATVSGNVQSPGVGIGLHYGFLINNINDVVTVSGFERHKDTTYTLSNLTSDINGIISLYNPSLSLLSGAIQALGISLIDPSIVTTISSTNVDFMVQGISPNHSIASQISTVRIG